MSEQGLDVRYTPNIAREPFQRFLARRGGEIQRRLASHDRIDEMHRKMLREVFQEGHPSVELPVVLSAALSRASTVRELPLVLGDLRQEAEPFRKRRREFDQAAQAGDYGALSELRDALATEARLFSGTLAPAPVAGVVAVAVSAATANPLPLVVLGLSVVLGAVQGINERVWTKLRWRVLKPPLWFVAELGTAARGLTDALPTIGRIWNLDEDELRGFQRSLSRLGTGPTG
jgi:hypothetical protein